MYRKSYPSLLLLLLALAAFPSLSCTSTTSSVANQGTIASGTSEHREAEAGASVTNEETAEEKAQDRTALESEAETPEETLYLEDELPPLRAALRVASSWDELESIVGQIRRVLDRSSHQVESHRMIDLESEINREIAARVESLPGRENLSERESCFSNSQCTSGVCAGQGCLPGQWTCTTRARQDERHTRDMRRACLCNGTNYEGSSTGLRGLRVRDRNGWCSE